MEQLCWPILEHDTSISRVREPHFDLRDCRPVGDQALELCMRPITAPQEPLKPECVPQQRDRQSQAPTASGATRTVGTVPPVRDGARSTPAIPERRVLFVCI